MCIRDSNYTHRLNILIVWSICESYLVPNWYMGYHYVWRHLASTNSWETPLFLPFDVSQILCITIKIMKIVKHHVFWQLVFVEEFKFNQCIFLSTLNWKQTVHNLRGDWPADKDFRILQWCNLNRAIKFTHLFQTCSFGAIFVLPLISTLNFI